MNNKRSFPVNQALHFLDNLEVSSRASDSKYDGNFQFENIYCKPPGSLNYGKFWRWQNASRECMFLDWELSTFRDEFPSNYIVRRDDEE